MRINDAYRETSNATDAAPVRPPPADAAQAGTASDAGAPPPVTVTVSDKAKELSSQTSEASDAKVAALQSSIAGGTFKVDAARIAARIVGGE